jgi:osmotically-inducible protein OsmY
MTEQARGHRASVRIHLEGQTMKTDSQLQRDVQEQLKWEPSIRDAEIGVSVKDGVVTLSGFVDSFAEKWAAVRAVERLDGVKAAVDSMEVQLPSLHTRSDTDIAHAAVRALEWDIQVPNDRIKMTVRDGWITLEGEVEWQYQRTAAERAVRYLTGVKGLTSLISVKPRHVSSFDVSGKIREALRRSAELDSERITVETHDGNVTLKGTVRSYAERRDAERAAWAAPGVTKVDDRIAVNV